MGSAAKRMAASVSGFQLNRGMLAPRLGACPFFFGSLRCQPIALGPLHAKLVTCREFKSRSWSFVRAQCADYAPGGDGPKLPARLALRQQELNSQVVPDLSEPVPKISLEHVTLSFARSGGAGGQNVNKVNTKVDMRFNVMGATWLPARVRSKLMHMEKNRINSDGELFISSTKTRTQKGNIDDALAKLQQLIDAAAYEPPPVSEEKKKRIQKLAKVENEKRLDEKKRMASKKTLRRSKGSWD